MFVGFWNRFCETVRDKGDTVALKDSSGSITYSELEKRICCLSDRIINAFGSYRGNVPVVIYQNRGIDFVVSMLAVIYAGAYYIPLEKPIPIERVKYICEQINPALIISDEDTTELPYDSIPVVTQEKAAWRELDIVLREDDLVYVMFTSGTAGTPKGVKISYGNLSNLVFSFWNILYFELTESVNIGVLSSFGFDASVKMIYSALTYGHTLVIADKSVINFGRKIHYFHVENDIFVSDGTPSHLRLMILQKTRNYTNTRYFLVGGENLEFSLLRDFSHFINRIPIFINVYGPTECCVDIAYNRVCKRDILEKDGYVPIGNAFPNNSLEIHDSDNKVIDKPLQKGELWIRGNQVGYGYVDGENRGFLFGDNMRSRIYRTGDIAMYNEDGDIVILGRADRQVKVHGNRVELDEISMVLKKIGNIVDADVEFLEIDGQKILVALVVAEDEVVDIHEWNAFLAERLPKYMLVQKYVIVKKIPLTDRGKIDRASLDAQMKR